MSWLNNKKRPYEVIDVPDAKEIHEKIKIFGRSNWKKETVTETDTELGNIRVNEVPVKNDYFNFDNANTTGIDINGFLFFPKSVNGDESFAHREFVRTKIMSGGEYVSRGQYIPREFSFDTLIDIEPKELDKYYKIFKEMENMVCTVTSPYTDGMFKAEVNINVVNPEASPHILECKVKIKEIPSVMARLKGDPIIQYPSINTVSDVKIKENKAPETPKKKKKGVEHEDIYGAYNSSQPGFNRRRR